MPHPARRFPLPDAPWTLAPDATLRAFQTTQHGLTTAEADARRQAFGSNRLTSKTRRSLATIIFLQCKSPLIVILLIASGVTAMLGIPKDSLLLLATVLLNVALGSWQESKAEHAIQHLTKYLRTMARVRRDGHEQEVDAEELVPGDLVRLTQGERIPADVRLLTINRFTIDEAVLTGESLPVEKSLRAVRQNAPVTDRTCIAFLGTIAQEGYAEGVVVATGDRTTFGAIAKLTVGTPPQPTPLQKAVKKFAWSVSAILLCLTVAIFVLGILKGAPLQDMLLIAVAMAASAVPEGLPITLTVILAVGVERLAKRRAIIRRLLAGETLGSTTLILTDKTGTLTEARMSLTGVTPHVPGVAADRRLLQLAVSCVDVVIENPEAAPREWSLLGRAMESSLAREAVIKGADLRDIAPLVRDRIPFTSSRKYSGCTTTVLGETRHVVMGAPEAILASSILSPAVIERVQADIAARASRGERLIAVASTLDAGAERYAFEGLIAFRDPVRASVPAAVARIHDAGVRTVIVTGDHPGTAASVAQEIGILAKDAPASAVQTAEAWEALSDAERKKLLPGVVVFARVAPDQKASLVRMYLAKGEVVAVTGDGVNDGPALEAADIGIAVGSGTDVAKDVADLVLLDDDFESIVTAIEEGRKMLANIRKAIVFLLSDVFTTLILTGGALFLGLPLPLTALQILYVNFFSDSFPSVAYAFEQSDTLQKRRPVEIPDRQMLFLVLIGGISMSAFLFAIYAILLGQPDTAPIAQTFLFTSFAVYTLFAALMLRSLERPGFSIPLRTNPAMMAGVGIGFLLTACAVYVPFLRGLLGTQYLPLPWFFLAIGCAFLGALWMETAKWAFKQTRRDA